MNEASRNRFRSVEFVKATQSAGNGQCVEVGRAEDVVLVRDSKDVEGPVLVFAVPEWQEFLDGIRNGDFDALFESAVTPGDFIEA